jgi:hypothetical protein
MIVHNIGEGPKMERRAFQLENYRYYRYFGPGR